MTKPDIAEMKKEDFVAADKKGGPAFLRKFEPDEKKEFRMTVKGEVFEGHYKNKERLLSVTEKESYKFVCGFFDGLYYVKNTDYGYIGMTEIKDERGAQYDAVENNLQGYEFDGQGFGTVKAMLAACHEWLEAREFDRSQRERQSRIASKQKRGVDRL